MAPDRSRDDYVKTTNTIRSHFLFDHLAVTNQIQHPKKKKILNVNSLWVTSPTKANTDHHNGDLKIDFLLGDSFNTGGFLFTCLPTNKKTNKLETAFLTF